MQCGESVTIEGQAYTISAVTHRYQLRKGKYEPSEKRLDVLSTGRYILNLYLESLLEKSWSFAVPLVCKNLLNETAKFEFCRKINVVLLVSLRQPSFKQPTEGKKIQINCSDIKIFFKFFLLEKKYNNDMKLHYAYDYH